MEKENKINYTKKLKNILTIIVLLIIAGGICWLGGSMTAKIDKDKNPELSAVMLEQKLTDINELASVTYSYTNMAQFENSNDFYGKKVPFTTKSFILTYDGVIKAGIDLSQAEISVSGKKIHVSLPEAKILSHQIDEESVEVFDEKTSIFNSFRVEDYNSFRRDQQKEMEAKAVGKGLLDEAGQKAQNSVEMMLSAVLGEEYELVVEQL